MAERYNADEVRRLRDALWRIKVDPHGHPGRSDALHIAASEDDCPVCATVNAALNDESGSHPVSRATFDEQGRYTGREI
ncbi:MAG TPA: hypothetical protein VFI41_05200 [Gemmatimonadales bacterium]|nr:hypothetical protein [Gemmatimonadales bacterium]